MSEAIRTKDWLHSLVGSSGQITDPSTETQAPEGRNELLDALVPALEEVAHITSVDRAQVANALAMIDGSDGATVGSPILQWLQTFYEEAQSGKLTVSAVLDRAKEIFSLPSPAGLPAVEKVWAENRRLTEIDGIDSLWDRVLEGVSSLCTNPIGTIGAGIDVAWGRVKSSFARLFGGQDE